MNNELSQKPVKTVAVVFLVIATIFLAAKTVSAIKDWSYRSSTTDSKPHITVSGTGEAFAIPTAGSFTFTITEEGKTVQDAQAKATDRSNKAIDYLKKAKIDEKDIKTLSYNINPHYEYQTVACIKYPCPPAKNTLTGYEVSQTIEVKVKDPSQSGTLLSGIGSLGVQNVSGLDFTLDPEEQSAVMREARQKAITDAKAKADVLASDLGVKIIRITDFQESGNPIFYERAAMDSKGAANQSAPTPQIPTGQNKVTSNVTITYEIR
jgi:uncharacterized protein YggE